MKANDLIPAVIESGMIIRTATTTGSGRRTRTNDMTKEVISLLEEKGYAAIKGNDSPRGGVAGNYVQVLGKFVSKSTLRRKVAKAISTDELYHGCGPYRLAVKDGKVVASLYGGYYGSCNYSLCNIKEWAKECARQLEALGTVISADGSGTRFYINDNDMDKAREAGIEVNSFEVPSLEGMVEVHQIEK